MWSGTAALKNIDQGLQTLRDDVVRLDTQLQQLSDRLAGNQRQRVTRLNDIAAVRLADIEHGELQGDLTAADHEAQQILQQRKEALTSLNQNIQQLNKRILELENQRGVLLEQVNSASQSIADIEIAVQTDLKHDSDYLARLADAQTAESVSIEAARKVQLAQADMAEKAAPYKQDKLFMYLWECGFGTTEYRGGLIAKFVDGWIARLINYQESRVNFWNLTEIPQRLAEHAGRVADAAEIELTALQQLETNALIAAGVDRVEEKLQQLRDQLDAHDDQLEDAESDLTQQLGERARYAAGQDEYFRRCLSCLTQAMDHRGLDVIHRYVRDTVSPTDDRMVIELQDLHDRSTELRDDLAEVRSLHDRKLNKLTELERVRRDFKNSRYDDVRSGFGNQALIASVLGEFLRGMVTGADLWRVLQRNQRYRDVGSVPDFGSGGLGKIDDLLGGDIFGHGRRHKRRKPSWHQPSPRRGGRGFKLPRRGGGRRNGGGFTTGGGF